MSSTHGVVRAAGFILFRRVPPNSIIEYLLMQTSYGKNHWTPPKGHVDPGESDYETALRETKEEAGLDENSFKVIPDFKCELHYNVTNYRDGIERPKIVTYWCAEIVDTATKITMSDEHQDFKWLQLEEAKKLSGFKDFNESLDKCEEKIKSL